MSARGIAVDDEVRASKALASASAAVRDAAGVPISLGTSTVTLVAGDSEWLPLPGPVRSVASVTVDGSDPGGWKLAGDALWRYCGWRVRYAGSGIMDPGVLYGPVLVVVTLTHGLDAVPEDIVDLVCSLAGAAVLSEEPHDPRVTSEAIDDSRTGWQTGVDTTVSVMELPERTRRMLASRFGGGVYVTGQR